MIETLRQILTSPRVSIVLRRLVENNFKRQREIIKKYFSLQPDDQILDLGCGTGEFSLLFPEAKYTGIDIDPKNIEYARARYQKKFLMADARQLPFTDSQFTKVLIVGVLHHLSDADTQQILREVRRVLKRDGKFLIMEDTRSSRMLVKLMQAVDQGCYIRSFSEWKNLIGANFSIRDAGTFDNGACFYSYFIA